MRRGLLAPVLAAALAAAGLPALSATGVPGQSAGPRVPVVEVATQLRALDPHVSADGRWVVFVGESGGRQGVHLHDTVTDQARQVAADLPDGQLDDPAVSDDGRWVVLTHRSPGEFSQVVLVDTRHDSWRRVSATSEWEPGNGDSHSPAISGDGSAISFTTEATDVINKPRWGAGSAPGADVVLARAVDEGFLVTLVSPEVAGVDFGSSSLDASGSRSAFASADGQLFVAEHDGTKVSGVSGVSGVSEVTRGRAPVLSADGGSLALLREQEVYAGGRERVATWVRDLATGAEVQADVEAGGWALAGDSAQPSPSADGSRVLLSHPGADGTELVLRGTELGSTTTVATAIDAEAGSHLSADGRTAAWVQDGTLHLADLADAVVAQRPEALWGALVMRASQRAHGGGYVLHAVPANWEPVRHATVQRQWVRDGRPIPGATGLTYEITAADVGHDVALRERLHVPGLRPGVSTSRAYRVRPDRAVLQVPRRVVRRGAGRVTFRVRVTTQAGSETYVPGSAVPQGRVRVRVGGRTLTRQVGGDGWVTVRLPRQRVGRTVVRVRHLGTPYVTPAPAKQVRVVVRPRR